MHDWFDRNGGAERRKTDWVKLKMQADAWLDSNVAQSWQGARERYDAASSFFARFRLTGWKRGLTEVLSEGLTLACIGLLGLFALAIPAFVEFDESKIYAGKYSVKFLDRFGNEIGKRGVLHNDQVPLDDIPDHLIKATMATEDRRFFDHFGVDFIGTARAFAANVNAGETVQGGSTLTQQLAKNLFLTNERSIDRKIKEVFLSFLLESRFSKREILKMYLDRAYMGGGAFGVEAAAQYYFGKSVRDVTLSEAAMMAGLFKAPTKYAPHVNIAAARGRANDVLSNLVEAGYMTAGQVHQATAEPRETGRQPRHREPGLVPRLGLRGGAAGRGRARRLLARRAHHDRPDDARPGRGSVAFDHPAIRQVAQRLVGCDRLDGAGWRGARDRRRSRLRRKPIQSRDDGAPAAGLVVQAVRLCGGHGKRLHVEDQCLR